MISYTEKQCLLCDSNENTRIKFEQNFNATDLNGKIFSARRTTEHYHYRFLECKKCGMVFSSSILPLAEISKLYEQSEQTYDKETSDIAFSYMQYIRNNQNLFTKQSALEIGCGNGFFLSSLKQFGFSEVYGIEPSREAVAKAGSMKEVIYNGIVEEASYPNNHFDLICCFQTLDHLVNPLLILKRVKELLKPGGIAYFIVHNQKGMQANVFGEKSPIYDVEHIYLFDKNTLPKVCIKAGLEVVQLFNVKNIYPLSYWFRMAPLPFKNIFIKILHLLGISNLKFGIYPGNIGIFVKRSLH